MLDKLKEFYIGKWREAPALIFCVGIAIGVLVWVLAPGHTKEGLIAALLAGLLLVLFGIPAGAMADRFVFYYARPHNFQRNSKNFWIAQWRRLVFISMVLLSLALAVG